MIGIALQCGGFGFIGTSAIARQIDRVNLPARSLEKRLPRRKCPASLPGAMNQNDVVIHFLTVCALIAIHQMLLDRYRRVLGLLAFLQTCRDAFDDRVVVTREEERN